MNKYYITWGTRTFIVLAGNEIAACIKAMNIAYEKYVDVVGTMFRVSLRGHDEHDDDFMVSLNDVIQIQMMSNNYTGLEDD